MQPRIVRALTLYQPWAHAVARGDKVVENRKWAPPKAWEGHDNVWIAIHAGKTYDMEGEIHLRDWRVAHPTKDKLDYAAILGVGRLARVRFWPDPTEPDKMFFGPYGWFLDHLTPLPTPLPVKGAMGLWGLPSPSLAVQIHDFIEQIPKQAMPPITFPQAPVAQADLFKSPAKP